MKKIKISKKLIILDKGFEDSFAYLNEEQAYSRLRTKNCIERLNEEIRRREKVIRIFPNEKSAIRLIGAILIVKSASII
ncbi:transposase-like protein [Peptoniphilus olsenii]|uniref:Transposase-like protein n=1 Tax=Peptoniphilus olsenii TaxID=411570 RepID=A0ABV2J7Y1_9FIRM